MDDMDENSVAHYLVMLHKAALFMPQLLSKHILWMSYRLVSDYVVLNEVTSETALSSVSVSLETFFRNLETFPWPDSGP